MMFPEDDDLEPPDIVELPIDGVLDLHGFAPREIADLVRTYLDECVAAHIFEVRLIHGKGTGVLRRMVHSVLDKHPAVKSYGLAPGGSSWGATVVELVSPCVPGSEP
ncbi:MAG: Smr/MutS family protein [Myxococcota bacterium]|jgi:dsDNA-specific endonuclease/ATPase MutS2|nr:Smr/MutS family protein [Myxococcota bacterium]